MQHTNKNTPFIKPSIDERHIYTDLEINHVYISTKNISSITAKCVFSIDMGSSFSSPFLKKWWAKRKGSKNFLPDQTFYFIFKLSLQIGKISQKILLFQQFLWKDYVPDWLRKFTTFLFFYKRIIGTQLPWATW